MDTTVPSLARGQKGWGASPLLSDWQGEGESWSSIFAGHWRTTTSGHLFYLSSQRPQKHRLWHRSCKLSKEKALKMHSFDHTSLCMFVFWDLSVSCCLIIFKNCQEAFVSSQQQLSQNTFPLQSKHWQRKSIFNPAKPAVSFDMPKSCII